MGSGPAKTAVKLPPGLRGRRGSRRTCEGSTILPQAAGGQRTGLTGVQVVNRQLCSEGWRVSWGWDMGPSDSPEPQPLHVPDEMCWQRRGKKQHVLDEGRAAGYRGGSWGSEVLSWGWGKGDGAASAPGIWSLAVPALPPLAPGPRGLAKATLRLPWVLMGPHPSPHSVRPGNVALSLHLGAVCLAGWSAGQGRRCTSLAAEVPAPPSSCRRGTSATPFLSRQPWGRLRLGPGGPPGTMSRASFWKAAERTGWQVASSAGGVKERSEGRVGQWLLTKGSEGG